MTIYLHIYIIYYIYLHIYTEGERLRVTGELVRLRVMPVQELVVDLGLERGALLWSCYNSLHIWDFSKQTSQTHSSVGP